MLRKQPTSPRWVTVLLGLFLFGGMSFDGDLKAHDPKPTVDQSISDINRYRQITKNAGAGPFLLSASKKNVNWEIDSDYLRGVAISLFDNLVGQGSFIDCRLAPTELTELWADSAIYITDVWQYKAGLRDGDYFLIFAIDRLECVFSVLHDTDSIGMEVVRLIDQWNESVGEENPYHLPVEFAYQVTETLYDFMDEKGLPEAYIDGVKRALMVANNSGHYPSSNSNCVSTLAISLTTSVDTIYERLEDATYRALKDWVGEEIWQMMPEIEWFEASPDPRVGESDPAEPDLDDYPKKMRVRRMSQLEMLEHFGLIFEWAHLSQGDGITTDDQVVGFGVRGLLKPQLRRKISPQARNALSRALDYYSRGEKARVEYERAKKRGSLMSGNTTVYQMVADPVADSAWYPLRNVPVGQPNGAAYRSSGGSCWATEILLSAGSVIKYGITTKSSPEDRYNSGCPLVERTYGTIGWRMEPLALLGHNYAKCLEKLLIISYTVSDQDFNYKRYFDLEIPRCPGNPRFTYENENDSYGQEIGCSG